MSNRFSNRYENRSGLRFGRRYGRRIAAAALVVCMAVSLAGCGGKRKINDGTFRPVDEETLQFPLNRNFLNLGIIESRNYIRISYGSFLYAGTNGISPFS